MRRRSIASGSNDRRALLDSVAALQAYVTEMKHVSARKKSLFSRMPARHQRIASSSGYLNRINDVDKMVTVNGLLAAQIAKVAERVYGVTRQELVLSRPIRNTRVIELLKHFVRDWSAEGLVERSVTISPILEALKTEFGSDTNGKSVLVPGAGVSRLAYDICSLGFQTMANEYSHLMHLGSLFVLEQKKDSYVVHPSIHNFSHQSTKKLQLRGVKFPDISPEFDRSQLRLVYGDFMKVSGPPESYNAVATLFFIDTAENSLAYIDAIHKLLKPGGIWINSGPIKWGSAPRVEFTLEEMLKAIRLMGFEVESTWSRKAEYVADSESLWHGFYGIEGWVARKKS
ncbi:N2227-like protein-domain-containing protein [Lipomyces japonicus]|uniref:N2227-like protein-domain-containing protein n=1 Tax=Lipomyces japonicus TaxID=56871 RepID=UPI0034CFAA16